MKKIICTLCIVFCFTIGQACEICGSGMGNYYIGMLPQFSHHFIGVRYHVHSFRTRLFDDPSEFSDDFYQTVELWGGWNIGKRVQVLAFVPYNINHQTSDEGKVNLKGLGDVMFLANYNVFNHKGVNSHNKPVSQQLWVGAGIKTPTGKFELEPNDPDIASVANRQLGSGSWDVLLNVMYNVRWGSLGLNNTVNYKINSANSSDYKFGNKVSANSFVYYAIETSKTVISPNVGLLYEKTAQSDLTGSKIDLTGGSLLRGSAGVEVSFNKVSVGLNMQLPIAQNFAENQTKEKMKGMMHVSFSF